MIYKIDKDRIRKIVYLYLNKNPKIVGIKKYKVNPFLYEFTKYNIDDDEFYDVDSPFRYYAKGFFYDGKSKDKSHLVINDEIYEDIAGTFGDDNVFMELVKDWFVDKYNLPVDTFEY